MRFGVALFFIFCVIALAKVMAADEEKRPLDNNPTQRKLSDKLDKALGWGGYDDPKQSKVRAMIHAGKHEFEHQRTGNPREHERAKDQWGVVTGGRTDNLERYDKEHFPNDNKKKE